MGPAGDYRIDGVNGGYKWGTDTITYSFYEGGVYYGSESSPTPLSPAVRENVRYILEEMIAPLVNVTFVEVIDSPSSYGLMRYLGSTSPGYAYAYYPYAGDTNTGTRADVAGDVVLNVSWDADGPNTNNFQLGPGSHGFQTLIHETGHALGLKHPGDYNGDGTGDPPYLPLADDNWDNSLMSYNFSSGSEPATPMAYDILALQYFYGANVTTRADDTTYVFTDVDEFSPGSGSDNAPTDIYDRAKHTLWDGGGIDTLDLSGLPAVAAGYRVDVRPGGWITTTTSFAGIGYDASTGSPTTFSPGATYPATDFGTRVALSGTMIENIVTSPSNDAFYLNSAANLISGYIPGRVSGDDAIYGSEAADTLDLSLFSRSSVTESQVGSDLVLSFGASGSATVVDYFTGTPGSRMQIRYAADPTITITADRARLRAGETAVVAFSLGMSTTNFTAGDVDTSGGTLTGFAGSGTAYTALFTPLAGFEGIATISVAAGSFTDDQGTPNQAGSLALAVDTIQPTVTIARVGDGPVLLGGSDLMTFTLSEPATDFDVEDVAVFGGSLSDFAGSGVTYTATFTPAASFAGTATLAVEAGAFSDAAGNPNLAAGPLTIGVDTVAPTLSITRSGSGILAGNTTETIIFRLSSPATDFTGGDITVTGGTLSPLIGSEALYTATFTPALGFQGTASVTVAAGVFTSSAGNPNQAATLTIPVDTVPPTLTITRSGSGPLTIGGTALITFTISETVTTFIEGVVRTTGGALTSFSGSGTTYTATFVPTAGFEGTASITVLQAAFTDAVGYGNTAASLSIPVDALAPTVTVAISGPGVLKVGDTATVTFTLSEPTVNFGSQSVNVSGGTLHGIQGFGRSFTATFVPAQQFRGTAGITVPVNGFTDLAGNANVAGNVVTVPIDTIAPRIVGFRALPAIAQLGIGGSVLLEAEFSESVTPGGSFLVRLDSGGQARLVVDGTGRIARGAYTAQPGEFSADLDVISVVSNGSIQNGSGNALDEALPPAASGLATNHAITVDARVKFIDNGNFSTDPLLVRDVRNRFRTIPLRFTAPVTGVTLDSLVLSVDGRPLPLRGARIQGGGTSYLLHLPVSRVNPVGIYTLSAVPGSIRATANGASATDQVSLYWGFQKSIGMVPNAPGLVTVDHRVDTGRRTSVVIGWQQPSGRGGGPVTQYLVQYRVAGTARWLSVRHRIHGWATSATISGVTPSRLYEFRVAAVNSAGAGEFTSSGPVSLLAVAGLPQPLPPTGRRA